MIINRWEAPLTPDKFQVARQYAIEGLDSFEEIFMPSQIIAEHRHPFCEVRTIIEGELLFNISGNQFLLRPGDRLEIPANTKHTHTTQGQKPCICLVGYRAI
jgi:gentisate 1,2-dioxygenase